MRASIDINSVDCARRPPRRSMGFPEPTRPIVAQNSEYCSTECVFCRAINLQRVAAQGVATVAAVFRRVKSPENRERRDLRARRAKPPRNIRPAKSIASTPNLVGGSVSHAVLGALNDRPWLCMKKPRPLPGSSSRSKTLLWLKMAGTGFEPANSRL
jgi:hypothetical protein